MLPKRNFVYYLCLCAYTLHTIDAELSRSKNRTLTCPLRLTTLGIRGRILKGKIFLGVDKPALVTGDDKG